METIVEPQILKAQNLTYGSYLKVPQLLELQMPLSKPAHHDEMLFIIIHQAYELWFKLLLHEVDTILVHMDQKEILQARHFANRVSKIMKLLVEQIHILETMDPKDFLNFRDRLSPASGFQSVQFRLLEFRAGLKEPRYLRFFEKLPKELETLQEALLAPDLRSRFFSLLRGLGFDAPEGADETSFKKRMEALIPLYRNPNLNLPLYLLCESLVDFDQNLGLWREHHVRVIERIIGSKYGTGGSSGVAYLNSTTSKKCFQELWDLRTYL